MLEDIFLGQALVGEYVFMALCLAGAWMIGRSIAKDWKSVQQLVIYTLLLGAGSRFLHFALYQAPFVSPSRYLFDTVFFLITAYLGYRYTRTNQMTRQYHWLYEKASPLTWKERTR